MVSKPFGPYLTQTYRGKVAETVGTEKILKTVGAFIKCYKRPELSKLCIRKFLIAGV